MNSKFKIDSVWENYKLHITKEYGFIDLSISPFVIKANDTLLKHNCKKAIDLGCGNGRHSLYLNSLGFDVYASDIDCSKIIKNTKKLNLSNLTIREHSFTAIPYDDDFFDVVLCTSTLHHAILSDIKQGINEVYRTLKPKSYFVFDFLSTLDTSYGIGTEIEKNTFIGSRTGEENIPHHYADENELKALLNNFSFANINKSIYSFYDSKNNQYSSRVFDVIAVK
ncbi:class I SAM-dependent methyltransferase [Clostridium neuense]|uniref:Class I SAM-dependent methyltransferase n=1 Tax=Clostridium neuense TaxID=1728934 RepID=A0ABW8TLK9_9CLOT